MMEDESRVKLIIIGFILVAVVVGYFLLSSRFSRPKVLPQAATQPVVQEIISSPTPVPPAVVSQSPSPALLRIMTAPKVATPSSKTTKGLTVNLPKTAFESGLLGLFSLSVVIAGWFLRRYPD